MKALKWLALGAVVVVVAATALYLRRDTIARGIASSMLGERGLIVRDLSVDSLGTSRVEFAQLVLESERGTRYELFGLSVPIVAAGERIRNVSADQLVVTFDAVDAEATMLSTSLATVLDLPTSRPGLNVQIARVSIGGFPALTNVGWMVSAEVQELAFDVGDIGVVAEIDRPIQKSHHVTLRARDRDARDVLFAAVDLELVDDAFRGGGEAMLHTAAWLPVLRSVGTLPAGLASFDAELRGPIGIRLDDEAAGRVTFGARLALIDELTASWRHSAGQLTDIRVGSLDELAIELAYPSLAWTARVGRAAASLRTDELGDLPVVVSALECYAGMRCTMLADVDAESVNWLGYDIATARFQSPLTIEIDETVRIDVPADVQLDLAGVLKEELSVEALQVTDFSGTQITVDSDGWRSDIERLQLTISGLAGVGELVASGPVTLSNLELRNSADTVTGGLSVPAGAYGSWAELELSLPGADGTFEIRNETLGATLELGDAHDALTARLELMVALADDAGSIALNDARVDFNRKRLSEFAVDWPYAWDIAGGTWGAMLDLEWQAHDAGTAYSGTMTHELDDLAGNYSDFAFVGLTTNLRAALDSAGGIDVSPSSIRLRLLDAGLPVEDITAGYALDPGTRSVDVENLLFSALGGQFGASPFRFSIGGDPNTTLVHVRSVQLQLMVGLLDFEDIEAAGALSGALPVTLRGTSVAIAGGRLESDAPGVIRWRSDDAVHGGFVWDSPVGVVRQALQNFEFDALTADVDYSESGDLKLRTRLSGINPDIDPLQPIILNLGVENNVPQMLRSLRAIRSIEDILRQQTEDQT